MTRRTGARHAYPLADRATGRRSAVPTGSAPAGSIHSGAESFLAGTASCRIETKDVDGLFAELAATDVLHPVSCDRVVDATTGDNLCGGQVRRCCPDRGRHVLEITIRRVVAAMGSHVVVEAALYRHSDVGARRQHPARVAEAKENAV